MSPSVSPRHRVTPRPRIALIGPGSIGGATAALLTRAGCDVEVVCRTPEVAALLAGRGMRISGARGSFTVPLKTVAGVEKLSGSKDFVLLATKSADTTPLARAAARFMEPGGLLVSLQNGMNVEAITAVVGRERAVGCVVGWGAAMHEHGSVEITSRGRFIVGLAAGGMTPRLDDLRAILGRVMPTRISRNIDGDLYSKLILN